MRRALLSLARSFSSSSRDALLASCERPDVAEAAVLGRILAAAERTERGQRLGLRRSMTMSELRAVVPVSEYVDLEDDMERQRVTGHPVLTPGRVLFYERTSGSTSAVKHIPINDALRRCFTRLFAVWVADVLADGPTLRRGDVYFTASAGDDEQGSRSDLDYLHPSIAALARPFFATAVRARRCDDAATFQAALAGHLFSRPSLEVMSLWSPTYLSAALAFAVAHPSEVCAAMEREGTSARRRRQVAALLEEGLAAVHGAWPELRLLSCWASAGAREPARALAALFPGVTVQPKGLLATEGPVTVPLFGARHPVPLIDDVVIELEDERGEVRSLHEGRRDELYSVVLTQPGGLLRYRLGDVVRLGPAVGRTPTLELLGRTATSDLAGEKLSDGFVAQVLANQRHAAGFTTLLPRARPRLGYVLVVDRCAGPPGELARDLDRRLCAAFHYQRARQLGQLGAPEVWVVPDAGERFIAHVVGARRNASGAKVPALWLGCDDEVHARFYAGARELA